jgi:hypothetical protein
VGRRRIARLPVVKSMLAATNFPAKGLVNLA